jgi:menaquinone-dependent protoporphyrinogen oxidase
MRVLVAYASRHGSTRGIAERIGERLSAAGMAVDVSPVGKTGVSGYDAVVLGSALYMFHWLGEARSFAKRNRKALAGTPVWLFSSGPFGNEPPRADGRSVLEVSGPKEIDELRDALQPRDHRVFYGAWSADYKPVGLAEKLTKAMPGAWKAIPSMESRDWPAVDAWADEIAAALGG